MSPREVVDLTGSDDESKTALPQTTLPSRPSPGAHRKSLPGALISTHTPPQSGRYTFGESSVARPIYIKPPRTFHITAQSSRRKNRSSLELQELACGATNSERPAKRARIDNAFSLSTEHRPPPTKLHLETEKTLGVATKDKTNHGQALSIRRDWLKTALKDQIFPHIDRNLSLLKDKLGSKNRSQIGRRVAAKLCTKDLIRSIKSNEGRLSSSWEGKISVEAQQLVEKFSQETLYKLAQLASAARNGGETEKSDSQPLLSPISNSTHRAQSPDIKVFTGPSILARTPEYMSSPSPVRSLSENGCRAPSSPSISIASIEKTVAGRNSTQKLPRKHVSATKVGFDIVRRSEQNNSEPSASTTKRTASYRPTVSLSDAQMRSLQDRNKLRLAGMDPEMLRPYLQCSERERLKLLVLAPKLSKNAAQYQTASLHVDFTDAEMEFVLLALCARLGATKKFKQPNPQSTVREQLQALMKTRGKRVPELAAYLCSLNSQALLHGSGQIPSLYGRSEISVESFLYDATDAMLSHSPCVMRLKAKPEVERRQKPPASLARLFVSREIHGDRPRVNGGRPVRLQFSTAFEDTLARRAEWSDCSGDIASIVWTPSGDFVCGAVTHSDSHNMQYNKPGNLIHGSIRSDDVFSLKDHRIPRPIVEKGDNSLASMRNSQDPWMYSSVTSVAYKEERCFTGGFDGKVKIWSLISGLMHYIGQWEHDGHVNFVVTSPHHDMVATAADVGQDAIRVYDLTVERAKPWHAPQDTYSGDRANELAAARQQNEADWAYHVATIAWGKSPSVINLLLAGYSPRSYDCREESIPEERAKTGELCLWNVRTRSKISIAAAKTQNVFEVAWHPTQPIFIAATSPTGEFEDTVRTQIRLFGQTEQGIFQVIKTLDCEALDINEITLMPVSKFEAYITASCTDGCTYVWDSGVSDKPIHTLRHEESIDPVEEDYEIEEVDTGVCFAAWGKTTERFYTGSSDGVVKVWDVKAPENQAHIRDVLILSGGITAGAFSPNFEKLLIGDETGKIHLLSIDDEYNDNENHPSLPPKRHFSQANRYWDGTTTVQRPIVPHAPDDVLEKSLQDDKPQSGSEIGKALLENKQLVLHKDPFIGVLQGPNYAATGLFLASAHKRNDIARKLRKRCWIPPPWWSARLFETVKEDNLELMKLLEVQCSDHQRHEDNLQLEAFDVSAGFLLIEERQALIEDGVDFDFGLGHDVSHDLDAEVDSNSLYIRDYSSNEEYHSCKDESNSLETSILL